jgi:hypothetical protein
MIYNKLGFTDIIDIDKLIITNCELDELKELIVVNKYFNSIVFEQFSKLRKLFVILDEHCKIISNVDITKDLTRYSDIKLKQLNRKSYEFIFKLLRKNETTLVNKIIHHNDKRNPTLDRGMFYDLFYKIISENMCDEQSILRNLIKIHPPNVNWDIPIECFVNWNDDLQIDDIILTILDLLKAAIFVNCKDFIVTLIESYYIHELYNWDNGETNDTLFELNQLIK